MCCSRDCQACLPCKSAMMTDELWKAKHTKHASLELFSLPLSLSLSWRWLVKQSRETSPLQILTCFDLAEATRHHSVPLMPLMSAMDGRTPHEDQKLLGLSAAATFPDSNGYRSWHGQGAAARNTRHVLHVKNLSGTRERE